MATLSVPKAWEGKDSFHSFRSVGDLQMLKEEMDRLPRNNESIMGPSNSRDRKIFYLCVCTLVIAGAANDFLGKTIYQILPGVDSGWDGLVNDHWATICLAICAFTASSLAIFIGRESFKDVTWKSFLHMLLPSFMDFCVTVSRYLALVFLPAAMVTILKSGLQLVFLSIVRWCRGKVLGTYQWIGLFVLVIGLSVVALHTFLENALTDTSYTIADTIYGVSIMMFVGVCGAVRNTFEEILLKDYALNAFFIVGVESIVSLFLAIIGGIIILIMESNEMNANEAINGFKNVIEKYPSVLVCVFFFMTVVFLKDTMQMKVTKMSSAMTRKLFQQLYPLFTFTFSLILYLITKKYGDDWDPYTYVELIGFGIVLYGAYLYFLEPKYGLPMWLLTLFNISDADTVRRSTDLINNDKRVSSLLNNDFLQQNGIDTHDTQLEETKRSSYSSDQNETEFAMIKV